MIAKMSIEQCHNSTILSTLNKLPKHTITLSHTPTPLSTVLAGSIV